MLGLLVGPSWVSGLVVVFVALSLVIGTVVAVHFRGSSLEFLLHAESAKQQVISNNTESLNDRISGNTLISNIPLLILWGGVGVIAYSFTMKIFGSLQRAINLHDELDYVHADRQKLLKDAGKQLVIRLLLLAVWLAYISLTLHILLPYVIASAYAGSGYILWALLIAIVTLHIHVVMLRLISLRPRLFGDTASL